MAVNGLFVKPAAITIGSLLRQSSCPERYHFWIVTEEAPDPSMIQEIETAQASYTITSIPEAALKYAETMAGSANGYLLARLCLHDLLPESVEKVLLIDADTIVLKSLDSLFDTPLDDRAFAAVQDNGIPLWGYHSSFQKLHTEVEAKTPYYNCGVLLLNLNFWRSFGLHEKVETLISNYHQDLVLADQDLLNLLFSDAIVRLPLSYNRPVTPWTTKPWTSYCYPPEDFEASLTSQHVLHFLGEKPWLHRTTTIWDLYRQYAITAGIPDDHPGLQEKSYQSAVPGSQRMNIYFYPVSTPLNGIIQGFRSNLPIGGLCYLLLKRLLFHPYLLLSFPAYTALLLIRKLRSRMS